MSEKTGRWAGRNSDKDAVRGAVWDALDAARIAPYDARKRKKLHMLLSTRPYK